MGDRNQSLLSATLFLCKLQNEVMSWLITKKQRFFKHSIILKHKNSYTSVSHMLRAFFFNWPGVKDELSIMFDHEKGSSEPSKKCGIADKSQNKLEPAGECVNFQFFVLFLIGVFCL